MVAESALGICSACTRHGVEQSVEYIAPEPHFASVPMEVRSLSSESEDLDVHEDDDRAHSLGIYFQVHCKDHPDGDGVEEWPDGARYEGQFHGGLRHGVGRFAWTNGSSYIGNFVENDIQGDGVFTWNDGCRYQGQWKANSMNGEGFFSWRDGQSYKGQYVDDRRHGLGIFRWADGSRFEGLWKVGKQDGAGVYVTSRGHQRKGEWRNGCRQRWIVEAAIDY